MVAVCFLEEPRKTEETIINFFCFVLNFLGFLKFQVKVCCERFGDSGISVFEGLRIWK